MPDPRFDAAISRRRFLGGIGTTAAGLAAVAALGPRLETIAGPLEPEGTTSDIGAVTLLSPVPYDVQRAGSYIAQQRGKVPLSSRGSRATTLR